MTDKLVYFHISCNFTITKQFKPNNAEENDSLNWSEATVSYYYKWKHRCNKY